MRSFAVLSTLLPLGLAQTLCDQYGYHSSSGYYLNNNMWGKNSGQGSQCTYVDKISSTGVSWHTDWNWSGGENNVKSYPYSGVVMNNKPLVSNIGSLPSKAEWQYQGGNIRANVAYDLFTAANQNHDTSSGDYELMVWLGRLGNVYPIGSKVGNANVGGRNWELYEGMNGAMKVFSFVAPSPVQTWEGNLKDFFNYITQNRGFPASSQYLITNQFGTEPFTGQNAKFNVWFWFAQVK